MRAPLVVAWRIALGLMTGTIAGAFAGLVIYGADLGQGEPAAQTAVVGGLGGGTWVWLWEWWHAREARRVADRLKRARRKGSSDPNDASDGA